MYPVFLLLLNSKIKAITVATAPINVTKRGTLIQPETPPMLTVSENNKVNLFNIGLFKNIYICFNQGLKSNQLHSKFDLCYVKSVKTIIRQEFSKHSVIIRFILYLPVQVTPFPEYPILHVHLNDPGMLVQSASLLQLCVFVVHSLISEENNNLKLCVFVVHSLISEKEREKNILQSNRISKMCTDDRIKLNIYILFIILLIYSLKNKFIFGYINFFCAKII
ncbi:hypothetical protein KUTeg_015645 [Tegillarca granosa]|uniref:Uncharacterized protein n=1 Tax=Tegillarca granosa TaxID=220873 RepID=A0ABQ9ET57_TEGGR|nr:hypothetical protein KUTeg_015645 [Tegillarca granosa]